MPLLLERALYTPLNPSRLLLSARVNTHQRFVPKPANSAISGCKSRCVHYSLCYFSTMPPKQATLGYVKPAQITLGCDSQRQTTFHASTLPIRSANPLLIASSLDAQMVRSLCRGNRNYLSRPSQRLNRSKMRMMTTRNRMLQAWKRRHRLGWFLYRYMKGIC